MSKLSRNLLRAAPLIVGASLLNGLTAIAAPVQSANQASAKPGVETGLDIYDKKSPDEGIFQNPMSQVTSVSELRDVKATEWAYEALRSLVERYGVIVGYPDRTFRGNRALTRWEFAAGLNAAINAIERLLQENVAVLKEDIETLKRLAQEYKTELAALGARVDNLEGRVAFLEDHQFSTTTKLGGQVIFAIADAFGNKAGRGNSPGTGKDEAQAVFGDRVRLNLSTSFTGKDLLRTRIQAGNLGGSNRFNALGPTGTNQTRLSFDNGSGNNAEISKIFYRTRFDNVTVWLGAVGVDLDDIFDPNNTDLADNASGALSRLQLYNQVIYTAPSGTGGSVTIGDDALNFTVGYVANEGAASDPSPGAGLFNGDYSAGAQIFAGIGDFATVSATYLHTYQNATTNSLFGGFSSVGAEQPFFQNGKKSPVSADRFGLQANVRLSELINLNAWGGYANLKDQTGTFASQDVWTWNFSVSFIDLLLEGSKLWIGGGQPPKASSESGTSYIVEAGWRLPINNNIFITPGSYAVFNANNDNRNQPIYVGVIRTTFQF